MKKLLFLVVAIVALGACGGKKQNEKFQGEARVDIPKELESKMFNSFDELFAYLADPIDSVNRAKLSERWFVLPEQCKGDEMLVRLVDTYNSFAVLYELRSMVEMCSRFGIDLSENLERIDCAVVKDVAVVSRLEEVKSAALEFSKDYENEDKEISFVDAYWELDAQLAERYHLSNFTALTEDEYNAQADYHNFVPEYDSLAGYICSGDSAFLMDRIWSIAECENITAKSIHAQLYMYADKNQSSEILPILEYIMDKKEATHMMSLVWRYWRCLYQQKMGGMSRDSDIFNDYYNARRLECANVLFEYIEQNPTDGVIINEFLLLATTPDIYRYGEFEYGNQTFMEMHMLLPMCGLEDIE